MNCPPGCTCHGKRPAPQPVLEPGWPKAGAIILLFMGIAALFAGV